MLVPAGSPIPDEDAVALRLVLYFDVFDHPLADAELAGWLGADGPARVDALTRAGRLVARDGRLCLPGREALAARRRERAVAAERLWPTARRSAALLARFPWIRGILVTGGLSKNSVGPDADVDFLLLVSPGRVWLAKSALEALRRALPRAGREALCTNYLLSTDHLEIPEGERDIYAAAEIVTARPLYGPAACRDLFAANLWVRTWFPGFGPSDAERAAPLAPPSRRVAGIDALDGLARAAWDRYWTRKYRHLDAGVVARGFRREPQVCANHLDDWRAPVLARWRERLTAHGVAE